MVSPRLLLLEQSDFLSNYVGSFQELRTAEELFDVTLACEDETLEAHKVVLSACSPFFRRVLSKAKQNHPFIYLKGVLHKDLLALLDYIYTGETRVPEEDVNRFIEAAQELKIKGLTENELDRSDIPPRDDEEKKSDQSNGDQMEIIIDPFEYNGDESSLLNGSSESEEGTGEYSKQKDKISELQLEIAAKVEQIKDDSGSIVWKCKECGKEFKKKSKLAMHIEIHLDGFSHACTLCDREYKTRNSLNSHKLVHREKKEIKKEAEDESGTDNDDLNDSNLATNSEQDEKLRTEILNRMEKVQDAEEGSMWKCKECGKTMKNKNKLKMHVEIHLEGFSHKCVHCEKIHKTRSALKTHISIFHKENK